MNVIEKAIQLVEEGHIEEAMDILDRHLTTCSDDDTALVAQLYMEWGFFEEASTLFEQLLQTYIDNDELRVILASIYIELEKDEQAFELLDMIDKDDPAYAQALLQQADLYESQGLHEVAEQKLLEAKEIMPDEIIIDLALGELLFSIGEYNRALTFYERVVKKEEEIAHVDIKERMAECLAALGQYETALSYYESLEDDNNPDTLFKHGLIAYYAERNVIAIHVWNNLIKLDPYYHSVYVNLSQVLYEEEQFEEAFNIIKKGLKVDEYNKELYLLASKVTFALNLSDESEHYAREAIKLDVDYKEAILFLVNMLKNDENYEEIVNVIRGINEAHTYDPDYEWELAKALYELESYEESLKIYGDIYNDLKNNSIFLKEYGYFLTEEGQINEAIDVFTNYLQLIPDDEDIILFLERLETSAN